MQKLTHSYYCGTSSTQIIYETIGAYFDGICEAFPENDALVVRHQGIRWSYRELQAKVDAIAAGLIALGIEPGDRVGIWGPNSAEWVVVQLATAKIGAIMVCINPAYRLYELEYALNKVECKAVVSAEAFKSSDYLSMLNELASELRQCDPGRLVSEKLPNLTTVIRMGEDATPGMFNFDQVLGMGGETETQRLAELQTILKPDDPINIQFTSGTTGNPKGATLTHCNILNNGFLTGEAMRLTDQDRLCIPVPLYHCFGMVLAVLSCVTHGSAMVFPGEAFDPLEALATVEAERCTALHGVPTMFIGELDHPRFAEFDISSLRTGIMAGAPCPIEVMKRVLTQMHMEDILIAYGQTELSPINNITLPNDSLERRTETVGRAMPWVEIKIVDEDGRVVATGQKGEICTRGYSVMRGYWNDPERTAETIDAAGWLHSGDLATMDEEGYVRIVGRIKDMIIRGGENIYPREVEEFLYQHPAISEVQVFGIPDEKMGEQVCAWVQLNEGMALTEDELKAYCKDQITHFKIPRYVRFVTEYPMTVTGKIQKFVMRDQMVEMLENA
ncbi:MAG: AMP-binding protein [Halieaceae bacterium MED-G27]|jgi:fatty-acyl-CoA synthase|nr:AMP-binding protein [Halieaceae bacterium]OUT66891.1 MAG: AMP-binding protein [Cellvibrionales bacterium TMED21]PDH37810.1 MAG: AMP-binding protein [Halieaceae bacterium MED-G27]